MKTLSTKRALFASVLSFLLCVTMLVGSTFAWFTDTATASVNTITAGTLDVSLEMLDNDDKWVSAEGKALQFLVDGKIPEEGTEILWEPGCTYSLPKLRVTNDGNLALKYKVALTGIKGDAELNDVIDWTIDGIDLGVTKSLAPKASAEFTITGHMQETAGNAYMGKTIDGISLTVYATQDTAEKDTNGSDYDKDAAFPVTNADELTAALQSKESIVLANDITIDTDIATAENMKQTLDFNGHKIILGGEDSWSYGCLDVYGELTLTDSVGNGGITGKFYHTPTKVPTAVFINDGATVNLKSGTIENVYRGVANYYSGGTFNMTGGKIAVKRASEIESAGVLFHRSGTVNLLGGEISGAISFEQTETLHINYTIGSEFINTNNTVYNTSGVTAQKNADGIWISTIR